MKETSAQPAPEPTRREGTPAHGERGQAHAERMELIRGLCSFEGRHPGTDAERRAANWLAAELRRRGRRAEVEPTYVHPEWSLVLALHAAIGIAGSLLATVAPALGFALVLLAATSFYLDQSTRAYLLRRLFFRRASQNVVSPGRSSGAPAVLVLSAHYDAAKTGWIFGERAAATARRLGERWRLLLGPFRIIFWGGLAPLIPILGARMAGIDAQWLSIVQILPTMVLVVSVLPLADIALSEVVPGANDNASGVAAALSAAAALDREPPANLDVWLVLPGAEECNCEGMRAFVRDHDELGLDTTYFINIDTVGEGSVHYEVSEGAVISLPMGRRLVELSEAIAAAGREGANRFAARPLRNPLHSDALPARLAGHEATTITCLNDGVPPATYHTPGDVPETVQERPLGDAIDFTLALVRALDTDVGRRLAARPQAPA